MNRSDRSLLSLKFVSPGLYTSVQDQGRYAGKDLGIPFGGAMDQDAMREANRLVGNRPEAAVLEITLLGPTIIFDHHRSTEAFPHDVWLALTGADLSPALNGIPVRSGTPIQIRPQDQLRFGKQRKGCRTYLAINGAFQIPNWLGSVSASMTTASTWTPQAVVRKDDRLTVEVFEAQRPALLSDSSFEREAGDSFHACGSSDGERSVKVPPISVRTHRGPEYDWFSPQAIETLLNQTFHLSADSNRMGYRLDLKNSVWSQTNAPQAGSKKVILKDDFRSRANGMISSGVFPGVVQLTPTGMPIVLMRDCQTSGGYPRIAVVERHELNRMGQLRPGDSLRLQLV